MSSSEQPQLREAPFAVTVATMAVVAVIVVGQSFVVIPLMPKMGAAWDVPVSSTAWMTTVFGVVYAFGSLVSGPLANRYGRRKVIVAGLAATGIATVAVPFASGLGPGIVLRSVQGLVAGAYLPMSYVYLSERVQPERLPLALTTVNTSAAASVVIAQVGSQFAGDAFGWPAIFWISGPLLGLSAIVVGKMLLADPPISTANSGNRSGEYLQLIKSMRVAPLFITTLTVIGGLTAIYTGVQLHGPDEIVAEPNAMLALRASALPAMVIAVLVSPMLGKIPAAPRAVGALTMTAVGSVMAAPLADSAVGLGVALFVFVFGTTTAGPAIVQAVGTAARNARATAMAVYGFMLNMGSGLGAQLPLGFDGFAGVALFLAGIFVIGIALVTISSVSTRKKLHDQQPVVANT